MEVIKRNYLSCNIHLFDSVKKNYRKCLRIWLWGAFDRGLVLSFHVHVFIFFFFFFRSSGFSDLLSFYFVRFHFIICCSKSIHLTWFLDHVEYTNCVLFHRMYPTQIIIPPPNSGIYASELVHPSGANPCPRSTSISFFGQFYYAYVFQCWICSQYYYYIYDLCIPHISDEFVCLCKYPDLRRRLHRDGSHQMMANGHLYQNKSDDVVTHFNILLFGFISFHLSD